MRASLTLVLLALAPVASAQRAPLPTPGVFGEAGFSPGYATGTGLIGTGRVALGYRFANGLHVATSADVFGSGSGPSALSVGPEIGYSRALGPNTTLDVRVDGRASFYRGPALASSGYRPAAHSSVAEAAVTRRVGLGRGVGLAATAGVYGGVSRALDADFGLPTGSGDGGALSAEAGVVLGLRAEFDALGGRFSIGPYGGAPLVSRGAPGGTAYGGRGRSFVTFSF
ncbi:MAG TPA: hypothetical protein VF576_10275 [Rubricoccaceae bacterium]